VVTVSQYHSGSRRNAGGRKGKGFERGGAIFWRVFRQGGSETWRRKGGRRLDGEILTDLKRGSNLLGKGESIRDFYTSLKAENRRKDSFREHGST